jgi:hypothetical protein
MQAPRSSIVAAYASILNALEGADARTVMLKMSAAGQLLGATESELAAALAVNGASGFTPATVEKAPPKRGIKRKAVGPPAPGTKFLGKHVRVWWGEPYNAFYIGRVVDYQPTNNAYNVVYNEGTLEEEHAQEDLESMPLHFCKVVAPPKSIMLKLKKGLNPTPIDYANIPYKGMDELEVRIDKANNLEQISSLSSELDARVEQLKAMLEALGPESDSESDSDDECDDKAAGDDADAVALLATKQAAELGLDLDETLCDAGAPMPASPEDGVHTPRELSIVPTALQTATPVQPMRETPTSARALVAIDTPVDNCGASPENEAAPSDDDGASRRIIDFVQGPAAVVQEQAAVVVQEQAVVAVVQEHEHELPADVRLVPHDETPVPMIARNDAPLDPDLMAAPEEL